MRNGTKQDWRVHSRAKVDPDRRFNPVTDECRVMSDTRTRANYALLDFQEQLGESSNGLDVPWAEFVGNHRSSTREFTVPAGPATEAYLECQLFEVGSYGHEIVVNGDALTGFDIP